MYFTDRWRERERWGGEGRESATTISVGVPNASRSWFTKPLHASNSHEGPTACTTAGVFMYERQTNSATTISLTSAQGAPSCRRRLLLLQQQRARQGALGRYVRTHRGDCHYPRHPAAQYALCQCRHRYVSCCLQCCLMAGCTAFRTVTRPPRAIPAKPGRLTTSSTHLRSWHHRHQVRLCPALHAACSPSLPPLQPPSAARWGRCRRAADSSS